MAIGILKIKYILTQYNALDSFISNSKASEQEKRAMTNHFTWRTTPQGDDFWLEIARVLKALNLQNFPFSKEDLKTPIKIKTIKE